jgi:hypothetical protein
VIRKKFVAVRRSVQDYGFGVQGIGIFILAVNFTERRMRDFRRHLAMRLADRCIGLQLSVSPVQAPVFIRAVFVPQGTGVNKLFKKRG